MPVEYAGFLLKPYGFLDTNAALDVPEAAASDNEAECCGCHSLTRRPTSRP